MESRGHPGAHRSEVCSFQARVRLKAPHSGTQERHDFAVSSTATSAVGSSSLRWAIRLVLFTMMGLAGPCAAFAQVFALTGGSSTLLNAQGGSFEIKGENYTGRIDLGYFGRPSFGFFLLPPYHNSLLVPGDQPVSFLFPTPLFVHSVYFVFLSLIVTPRNPDPPLVPFP